MNEIKERYSSTSRRSSGSCFALYARRGWPLRIPHLALAAALVILSVRVPLSGFAIPPPSNASPILFGVYWLTGKLGGPENASRSSPPLAGLMSGVRYSARAGPGSAPRSCSAGPARDRAASAAAATFDVKNRPREENRTCRPTRPWSTAPTRHVTCSSRERGRGNRARSSLEPVDHPCALIPGARPIDVFADGAGTGGRRRLAERQRQAVQGALLVDRFGQPSASTMLTRSARGPTARRYGPRTETGTAAPSLYATGRYPDGWLADAGAIYLWPTGPVGPFQAGSRCG